MGTPHVNAIPRYCEEHGTVSRSSPEFHEPNRALSRNCPFGRCREQAGVPTSADETTAWDEE